MRPLPAVLADWQAGGGRARVDGVELFYRVEGEGPWLVLLHGFPTSSWDWHRILPLLTARRRCLAFDFPGYGLSEKLRGRDYSLLLQLDAAEGLMRQLGIRSFDLVSHDMGDSVACELLYRREHGVFPLELKSLVVLNGGVYMDLHRPLLTQRMLRTPLIGALTARLSGYRVFRSQYPRLYADPGQFDEAHYRAQWALILHNGGRATLAAVAGYMRERFRFGERWTGPLERFDLPLSIVWGTEDPVAVMSIAERLAERNEKAALVPLAGVGHYPQLEAPERVSAEIFRHLDAVG